MMQWEITRVDVRIDHLSSAATLAQCRSILHPDQFERWFGREFAMAYALRRRRAERKRQRRVRRQKRGWGW